MRALVHLVGQVLLVGPYARDQPIRGETLKGLGRQAKVAWSATVLEQVKRAVPVLSGAYFEIYAGADYTKFGLIDGLRAAGAIVVSPWEGLGLGERLARKEYAPRE